MTTTKSIVSFVLLLLCVTGLLSTAFAGDLYCVVSDWTSRFVGVLWDSCSLDQWWAIINWITYNEFIVEDDVDWF